MRIHSMEDNARITLLYSERVDDLCHMDDGTIRSMSRDELCELMEEFDTLESHMCDIVKLIANKRSRAKEVTNKVIQELKKRKTNE